MRILQVSTWDIAGGAEKIAWNLFDEYRKMGHQSWLAVGKKWSSDPDVFVIPNESRETLWAGSWEKGRRIIQPLWERRFPASSLNQFIDRVAHPKRHLEDFLGREHFDFGGTDHLLSLAGHLPDIVHCHNLHWNYFDLRKLPQISRKVPVILTLHDAWLLGGHCAHSFNCERWKSGCGDCPDLEIYPPIKRDATARNWKAKKRIFLKSHIYLSTPCQWLMERVEQSILAPAVRDARVIPNGVDLTIFRPADRNKAREVLKIPQNAYVILFAANAIRQNVFKDFETMREAIARVATSARNRALIFVALGENSPPESIGNARAMFIPYQKEPRVVSLYYQAADIYMHASRADTFPTSILEALACGVPVVATAVGGIPEQVEEGATGFTVPPGNGAALADATEKLLNDHQLRATMGARAAEVAKERYDLKRQAETYLAWYMQILDKRRVADAGKLF